MKLSEELAWRGFVNQTTYKDTTVLDDKPITFYFGVDPSADSMTVGNLAAAMMVKHFIAHGHKAILLVGGATGLIGDPDGKATERDLKTTEDVEHNKTSIVAQYATVFSGQKFDVVDNYDWFKDIGYVEFLREVGKHVPMRQMLGRDFVQSRLGESGNGISYAEFSYSLMQAYDFLYLHRKKKVSLQLCGADQWGNSIAGVDLIRRVTGDETHVWSTPLVVNKSTGKKFGKSEEGAVWLDPAKTTPTQFYQFWINVDDAGVQDYLKIYTMLSKDEIDQIIATHQENPHERFAQTRLAQEVTTLVHGKDKMRAAEQVTAILVGRQSIAEADPLMDELRQEIPVVRSSQDGSVIQALVETKLASSNTEARRFVTGNAIAINGVKVQRENFEENDFKNGRLLLRRGKAFKDSAIVELG
ncbi:MAG: tyrosine--tRNA ligase [Candidatus Saccharimonadales bacterium]